MCSVYNEHIFRKIESKLHKNGNLTTLGLMTRTDSPFAHCKMHIGAHSHCSQAALYNAFNCYTRVFHVNIVEKKAKE